MTASPALAPRPAGLPPRRSCASGHSRARRHGGPRRGRSGSWRRATGRARLIEQRVEIRRPRSGAYARDRGLMTRLGETVCVRKMSSPRSGIGRAVPRSSHAVARLGSRPQPRCAPSAWDRVLVKPKRTRAAHLQIGTTGGAHGCPKDSAAERLMTWTAKASATPIAMASPASTKRIGKARNSPAISQRQAVAPVSAIGGDRPMRCEHELPVGRGRG